MEDTHAQKSAQNYELLIRVDEQMKNLTREVREMGGTLSQRMALAEATKMSKEEAIERFNDITKVTDAHATDIATLKTQATQIKTAIKTWGTVAAVILGGLQIIQIIVAIAKS